MVDGNGTSHADPKIGKTLEHAREQRGLSLQQAEEQTKIRARYLRELERENFDVLPPVYVQGSLKTYANFLGLDGDSMTQELKRIRPQEDEPTEPQAQVEPPRTEYLERYLASAGAAAGADDYAEPDEDEEVSAGAAVLPAGNHARLYLASAAFLVLVVGAVALALTLPRSGQPAVSEVREPIISKAPSEVSRAASEENETATAQEPGANDASKPEQKANAPDGDTRDSGEPAGSGEQAQAPPDSTATPSAPPAETASTEPTPAENESAAPAQPAPAPSETPVREVQAPSGNLQTERPVQQQDQGPVKGFSINKPRVNIGGPSFGGTRTSDSCSRDSGRLELRWGTKDDKVC